VAVLSEEFLSPTLWQAEPCKEQGVHQGNDHEKLKASLPSPKAGAFQSQFGFVEAKAAFDLPAASVSSDDLECVFHGRDGFVGELIPRLPALSRRGRYQPQATCAVAITRMEDLDGFEFDLAFTSSWTIIDFLGCGESFAAKVLPSRFLNSRKTFQLIVFGPAQHKTDSVSV
jgi:hypothetical protein